jgi:hypothetical protein
MFRELIKVGVILECSKFSGNHPEIWLLRSGALKVEDALLTCFIANNTKS